MTSEGGVVSQEVAEPVPPCHLPLLDEPSGSRTSEMPGGLTRTPSDPHLYAAGSADGSGREKREEHQL